MMKSIYSPVFTPSTHVLYSLDHLYLFVSLFSSTTFLLIFADRHKPIFTYHANDTTLLPCWFLFVFLRQKNVVIDKTRATRLSSIDNRIFFFYLSFVEVSCKLVEGTIET